MAKSKRSNLFSKPKNAKKLKKKEKNNKIVSDLTPREQDIIKKNQVIKISASQSLKMLLQSSIPCCEMDQKYLWKLYTKGQERIETEFNLVKIIKSLRNLKIFIQNTSMDQETKFKVQNSGKNNINIDTDDEKSQNRSQDSEEPSEVDFE